MNAVHLTEKKPSAVENLKKNSRFLRGTLLENLADTSTGAITLEDMQVAKFHGIYQQDDRDLRKERRKQKLEKAFSFMIRVRVPGGVVTPAQWLEIDRLASTYGNETFKITSRQAFQLHGILKRNLKKTVQEINGALLDSLAACGDVNRNVMCNPNPHQSEVHAEVLEIARAISDHLTPRTRAYHEIWLDEGAEQKQKVTQDPEEIEPIYGKTYLPRKFKIVVAVPPSNDVDIFAQDLGFIAILEKNQLVGFNVTVGGGMGMTHGKEETFPRIADVIGFVPKERIIDVAEKIVLVQRDYGDRSERKHARLKYTIEDRGIEWFEKELTKYLGYTLEKSKEFEFTYNGDHYGWVEDHKRNFHLTLFIQSGRIKDLPNYPLRTGLRKIAKVHRGDFCLTANQNLIIANIAPGDRQKIEELLKKFHLHDSHRQTGLRLNSLACVALPTCSLALAEGERFLPDLIRQLEKIVEEVGLREDAITIRMTGCPNGCVRPYLAEIAMVGRAPGKYNVYLGGGFVGERLNKLYRQSVPAEELVKLLSPIIQDYAVNRKKEERFGDFVIRKGYVKKIKNCQDFHA